MVYIERKLKLHIKQVAFDSVLILLCYKEADYYYMTSNKQSNKIIRTCSNDGHRKPRKVTINI